MTRDFLSALITAAAASALLATSAAGQSPPTASPPASQKGAEILASKCLQCHVDAMWRDQRQDRRAWEATLYRMVARGAVWETEEINLMAEYLGADFGAKAPRASAQPK